MCLYVCLFVITVSRVSAVWVKPVQYKYTKDMDMVFRRVAAEDEERCSVCLFNDDDCIEVDQTRCEYYMKTTELVEEDEGDNAQVFNADPKLKNDVNFMLFNLIEKGTKQFKECVPYISRYTDCTKENICLGCQTCVCDEFGRWNCTTLKKCRHDAIPFSIDHHTLLIVLQNLRYQMTDTSRTKRSISYRHNIDPDMDTRSKLSEWFYGSPPFIRQTILDTLHQPVSEDKFIEDNQLGELESHSNEVLKFIVNSLVNDALPTVFSENTLEEINANRVKRWAHLNISALGINSNITDEDIEWLSKVDPEVETETQKIVTTPLPTIKNLSPKQDPLIDTKDHELLTFDDVLDTIAVEQKNNTRRKPPLDIHVDDLEDYVYDENAVDDYSDKETTTSPSIHTVTESLMEGFTEVVIDLLESAKNNRQLNGSKTKDKTESETIPYSEFDLLLEDVNDLQQLEPVQIMKREAPALGNQDKKNIKQKNETLAVPIILETDKNVTKNDTGKKTVADQNSVQRLVDNVVSPLNNVYDEVLKEINELHHIREELISFVKKHLDIDIDIINKTLTERKTEMPLYRSQMLNPRTFARANHIDILDRYAVKLKKDVYEVIRDVVGMQKLYKSPKSIPTDLKFLIKVMKQYVQKQGVSLNKHNLTRRLMTEEKYINKQDVETKSIKEYIVDIVERIDKDMPQKYALQSLSQAAKNILNGIIKQYYKDEFSQVGLRVYDPHYNLTNDLRNVGFKWSKMNSEIEKSSVHNQLHLMKMLHLVISTDIMKMNDALTLINFARTRRMVPIDELIGNRIVSRINLDLLNLNKKVLRNIKQNTRIKSNPGPLRENKKKDSFLRQVKIFLMNSKRDIMNLLKKNTPKHNIVKKIAKQKLDDKEARKLSEFEKTMLKWQTHFNDIPNRYKRSPLDFEKVRQRIRNILPKYLRGKVKKANENSSKSTNIKNSGKETSSQKATTHLKSTDPSNTTTPSSMTSLASTSAK